MLRMGGARAPKGGITIGGKHFVGGQFIPEEVLNAASEEERAALRDAGEGGQPTGDRRQPGIGFASPNKSDDEMTVQEAFAALNSERHKRMKRAFQQVDDALGLGYRQIDIVGDWGGAENSVLIEYDQYQDYDELRYAMAWKGLLAEQKAVIVFEEDPDGEQAVFDFEIRGTLSEVRDALSRSGLTERSIVRLSTGVFRIVIYDDGLPLEDSEGVDDTRESRLRRFGEEHNVTISKTTGRGEELGVSWDKSRDEGAAVFRRTIQEYEERWPNRRRYRDRPPQKMASEGRGYDGPTRRIPLVMGIGRRKRGGHAWLLRRSLPWHSSLQRQA